MKWQNITGMVTQHPNFQAVTDLTALLDEHAKTMRGPEAYALTAGGAISDMYANCIRTRMSSMKDIDVFVAAEIDLETFLHEAGLPFHPVGSGKYPERDVAASRWRGHSVHVVCTFDAAEELAWFDLCDRVAWCDGRNCWASVRAIECLNENLIDIHCLSTPVRTAVRIVDHHERYAAAVSDRAKLLIRKAVGTSKDAICAALKSEGFLGSEAEKVAELFI